ncbi:MAG: hypothetical protein HY763_14900 [Planctomycetes bacterium]|nr:hypothetical protein [Planctomycetota bacterium]
MLREAVWFAASCAIVLALARLLGAGLVDDAYIVLRYAQNIADGHGAVFNLGERVEGFSSPLWTLLLAGAVRWVDLELAATALGVVCAGALVLVARAYVRNSSRDPRRAPTAVVSVALACAPPIAAWSVSGMETLLFTLLVTATLTSAAADRRCGELSVGTALLLLAATATRMEGLLLAAHVAWRWLRVPRSRRLLLAYGAACALLLLLRYTYYGAWLPNPYYAKLAPRLGERIARGIPYVGWAASAFSPLLALGIAGFAAGRRIAPKRDPERQFVLGWVVLWTAYVVSVGGDNFAMYRFLVPALPAACLLAVLAFADTGGAYEPAFGTTSRVWRRAALPAAFAVSALLACGWEAKNHVGDVTLTRAWAKTGRWLAQVAPPDAVLATCVPGAMAYFSRRTTIDMLGLTDRTVATQGRVHRGAAHAHERFHTDYLYSRAPDVVVYHTSGRFRRAAYADPATIDRRWGNALYEFVRDPRCPARYRYATAALPDGTVAEMQVKTPALEQIEAVLTSATDHAPAGTSVQVELPTGPRAADR